MINCWFVRKVFDIARSFGKKQTRRQKQKYLKQKKNTSEVAFSAQVNQRDQFILHFS